MNAGRPQVSGLARSIPVSGACGQTRVPPTALLLCGDGRNATVWQLLNARLAGCGAWRDQRMELRLTRPFSLPPYALGATSCFMMPQRIAITPAATQIKLARLASIVTILAIVVLECLVG